MKHEIIRTMAKRLQADGVDLGDEGAAMQALEDAGYTATDIVLYVDQAIEIARGEGVPIAEVLGSGVGLIAGVAIWLAAYCILCPPTVL